MRVAIPKGRVVDLSQVLYPGQEQYKLEATMVGERPGETADIFYEVHLWTHVGTHVEMPFHFLSKGKDATQMPLDKFMGWAIVLDFRHKKHDDAITEEELQAAGEIELGDRVLLWTGRDKLYRTSQSRERPFLTPDACKWLVFDRKIALLGTDACGVEMDRVNWTNHQILHGNEVPVIESLANLGALTKQRIYLIALPWFVKGIDASPIRAIAIEPEGGT